jgi:hypothetical protein
MAAVVHGSAGTTPRVRAEPQASKAGSRALATPYGLNPKTVAKWRARRSATDAAMEPRDPLSTVLSPAEEAIIAEFRRRAPPSCRSTTSWAACATPSRSSSAALCTAACNVVASLGRPQTRRRRPSAAASPKAPSASPTSTAASYDWPRAGCPWSWTPTACPSSPSSRSTTAPRKWKAPPSSVTSSPASPTRSTPCSPTTVWPSPICPRTAAAVRRSSPSLAATSSTASTAERGVEAHNRALVAQADVRSTRYPAHDRIAHQRHRRHPRKRRMAAYATALRVSGRARARAG